MIGQAAVKVGRKDLAVVLRAAAVGHAPCSCPPPEAKGHCIRCGTEYPCELLQAAKRVQQALG